MAETFKKGKLITTAGVSGDGGYIGFYSSTAQNVDIAGPFIYDQNGAKAIITVPVGASSLVPISCTYIKPASGSVLGFKA